MSLKDQPTLARVVMDEKAQDKDREAALRLLTDPELIRQIACNRRYASNTDSIAWVRGDTLPPGEKERQIALRKILFAEKLTDQKMLVQAACDLGEQEVVRAAALSAITDAQALRKMAGDLKKSPEAAYFPMQAMARALLAFQHPVFRERLPEARLRIRLSLCNERWSHGYVGSLNIAVVIEQRGKELACAIASSPSPRFCDWSVPAYINIGELYGPLLKKPAFTAADLAELAKSDIPELAGAARAVQQSNPRP